MVAAIIDMSKNQRTVLGARNNSLASAVIKRASIALGPCYKLEISPKKAFNRYKFIDLLNFMFYPKLVYWKQ